MFRRDGVGVPLVVTLDFFQLLDYRTDEYIIFVGFIGAFHFWTNLEISKKNYKTKLPHPRGAIHFQLNLWSRHLNYHLLSLQYLIHAMQFSTQFAILDLIWVRPEKRKREVKTKPEWDFKTISCSEGKISAISVYLNFPLCFSP